MYRLLDWWIWVMGGKISAVLGKLPTLMQCNQSVSWVASCWTTTAEQPLDAAWWFDQGVNLKVSPILWSPNSSSDGILRLIVPKLWLFLLPLTPYVCVFTDTGYNTYIVPQSVNPSQTVNHVWQTQTRQDISWYSVGHGQKNQSVGVQVVWIS